VVLFFVKNVAPDDGGNDCKHESKR
jgi:hypothetical protein